MNASTPKRHDAGLPARPFLQCAFGLHHQPCRAEQSVAEDEADADGQHERVHPVERCAGVLPPATSKPCTNLPSTQPWAKVAISDPPEERQIPVLVGSSRDRAELESDTAENEAEQHRENREVKRRNDDREGERERREEPDVRRARARFRYRPRSAQPNSSSGRGRRLGAKGKSIPTPRSKPSSSTYMKTRRRGSAVQIGTRSMVMAASLELVLFVAADSGRAGRLSSRGVCVSIVQAGPRCTTRTR